jgi:hypothetical protein
VAAQLDASPFAVRPRVTELNRLGLIERSRTERRRNASGMNAAVWKITNPMGFELKREGRLAQGAPSDSPSCLCAGPRNGSTRALELKAERGRPTAAQTQFISEFRAAGGEASIVHGLDQALHTLEIWGLLRGHAYGFRKCVLQSAFA